MSSRKSRTVSACALLTLLCGCRIDAPIHVWQPAQLESTVGHQVAISSIMGPNEVSQKIEQTLIAVAPRDVGRNTELIAANRLPKSPEIALVAAIEADPSDVMVTSVARREGVSYVLRGEILEKRMNYATGNLDGQPEPLSLSWRLLSVPDNRSVGGRPIFVDRETAIDRYPDLGLVHDTEDLLTSAAARDTLRLITPWIDRQQIDLAVPYLMPGSKDVRQGCLAAHAGRWAQAHTIWSEVVEDHPSNVAAIHNLAIASAAAQDFSNAKQLARRAIRLRPTRLHKDTLSWIEVKQREYHEAFDLPDPPEGWFVTR